MKGDENECRGLFFGKRVPSLTYYVSEKQQFGQLFCSSVHTNAILYAAT